jgi:hypothetical protein
MKTELSQIEKTALAGYMVIGDIDAAYSCINKNSKANGEMFHKMALKWSRNELCKKFMDNQRVLNEKKARDEYEDKIKKQKGDPKTIGKDLTDKQNVITELQILYNAEGNSKTKSDILMKIADLERMKNESPKEEENRVHYYIPLKQCEHCPHRSEVENSI